jgi:hypothetical protein
MYWTPFTSDRWGNVLSGYWQARALALLAGYGFDAYGEQCGAKLRGVRQTSAFSWVLE